MTWAGRMVLWLVFWYIYCINEILHWTNVGLNCRLELMVMINQQKHCTGINTGIHVSRFWFILEEWRALRLVQKKKKCEYRAEVLGHILHPVSQISVGFFLFVLFVWNDHFRFVPLFFVSFVVFWFKTNPSCWYSMYKLFLLGSITLVNVSWIAF